MAFSDTLRRLRMGAPHAFRYPVGLVAAGGWARSPAARIRLQVAREVFERGKAAQPADAPA